MYKKLFFLFKFSIICSLIFFYGSTDQNISDSIFAENREKIKEYWKQVYNYESKDKTRSALKIIKKIKEEARENDYEDEYVKSLIYQLRLQKRIEEEAESKTLNRINKEIKDADSPAKQILSSIKAELLWQYYQRNLYKISKRTELGKEDSTDIATWSINKLIKVITDSYLKSVSESEKLKKIKLKKLKILVTKGTNTKNLQPTLYDLLVNRALNFFKNDLTSVSKPAVVFEIKSTDFFKDVGSFIKLKIKKSYTYDFKYYSILLYQNLLKFHLSKQNISALVDADLNRLAYVKSKSVAEKKDNLYYQALKKIHSKYGYHKISSYVSLKIAQYLYALGQKYSPFSKNPYRYKKKEALKICQKAVNKFPGTYGGHECKRLIYQIISKNISINIEKVESSGKKAIGVINYTNLNKLYFRIVKLTDDQRKEAEKLYHEKKIGYYVQQKIIKAWNKDVPETNDYQPHYYRTVIPELPTGYYILLISPGQNFSLTSNAIAYTPLYRSNIAFLRRSTPSNDMSFYVTDRQTGKPLVDADATVYVREYSYIFSKYYYDEEDTFETDSNGYFKIPAESQYRQFRIKFQYNNDTLYMDDHFYQYKEYQRDTKEKRKVVFFTDRSIYRPGQIIYFKGLFLKKSGSGHKIVTDEDITVNFFDVNHQKLSSLNLESNEFGTFHGSFTAPVGVLNGQMSIRCKWATHYFSVEEYKRPKFEVKFDEVKGTYKLNDTIKVEGTAAAYAGSTVDNASVKYRIVRQTSFPYWYYYWWSPPYVKDAEIKKGELKTDKNGNFKITFKAVPDQSIPKKNNPVFTYVVSADVTDITGETHSSTVYVKVGYVALNLSVSVPSAVKKEGEHKYYIQTTNLNGTYVKSKIRISVSKIKEPALTFKSKILTANDFDELTKSEFKQLFPHSVYKDEDKYNSWPIQKKAFSKIIIPIEKKKTLISNFENLNEGFYKIEFHAKDKFNEDVKVIRYFTLFSIKTSKQPSKSIFWFNSIKNMVDVGEKASFAVGSSEKNVYFIYEVFIKNKRVKAGKLILNNNKKIIRFPIKERYRGNFQVKFASIKYNRSFSRTETVYVPWSNKELKLKLATFRDKLRPGSKEKWKMTIDGPAGKKVSAEMLASMYDASLDSFRGHGWSAGLWDTFYDYHSWAGSNSFSQSHSSLYQNNWNKYLQYKYRTYPRLNFFGLSLYRWRGYREGKRMYKSKESTANGDDLELEDEVAEAEAPAMEEKKETSKDVSGIAKLSKKKRGPAKNADKRAEASGEAGKAGVQIRKKLNETAFFFPTLRTNKNGDIIFTFTAPEALTRWNFNAFAHTKDLKYGFLKESVVTQKELMVMPNVPRFFREGDTIYYAAKVSSMVDESLDVEVTLELFDAVTMKKISSKIIKDDIEKEITIKPKQSEAAYWKLKIPYGTKAVTYRIIAKADDFSDGEEAPIPVLTNRMLVTEALPLPIRGPKTEKYKFDKLLKSGKSKTIKHHKLSLEFTSNPAWYAVQALPYLMEYPYECVEQIFSRFYANSLASHIANSNPKIKKVFDQWKNTKALLSNLQKNQDLKSLLLEETPWLLDAKDEAARKKRIGLLFDLNKMAGELNTALRKLIRMQTYNGGWPWFPGMPESRYITQHIIAGMGHLDKLGVTRVRKDSSTWQMIKKAVGFLDKEMQKDYDYLIKYKIDLKKDNLSSIMLHQLYARSYFLDIPVPSSYKKAYNYYISQAKKYWTDRSYYLRGLISLVLFRNKHKQTAKDIIDAYKENAIYHKEMGMYWKYEEGYFWYQAPIETQALLIEAFYEIAKDEKSVDAMKVWLLKQKQVQDWKTTKATVEAIYALLNVGSNLLSDDELVEIKMGNKKIDIEALAKPEPGTGHFRINWFGSDILPEYGNIEVTKTSKGVAWGALFWQYFEDLDKITFHKTPLKIDKKLFLKTYAGGGAKLKEIKSGIKITPGDVIKVRVVIKVDRTMEYVHLKDMRAAGFEPMNVISRYKYQDGLGYYETTKDASTNFFIGWLPKGTYVFEYPLRVNHKGDFSNGITTIQCMYAPEFTSHSEGIRVKVF
jgi:hypothetical protein